MSPVKEPHFFAAADLLARPEVLRSRERDRAVLRAYLNGPRTRPVGPYVLEWDEYVTLFREVRDETAIGESSVDYIVLPSAARAIQSKLPDARLMFMLRDPAERLFSWYLMNLRRYPRTPFREWLRAAMNQDGPSWQAVETGCYATHLERFYALFPRDQVRVYLYEAYRADAAAVLRDMFAFIDVDPAHSIDVSRRHHETRVPRSPMLHSLRERILGATPMTASLPAWAGRALSRLYNRRRETLVMDPDDRRAVVEHYRDQIVRTGDLIGRDLTAWLRA